jgi:hypothetical protein
MTDKIGLEAYIKILPSPEKKRGDFEKTAYKKQTGILDGIMSLWGLSGEDDRLPYLLF